MGNLRKKIGVFLYPFFNKYSSVKSELITYPVSTSGYSSIPAEKMKAYNKVRFHGAKKLFCYNPFVNLFFDTSGNAVACCRSHQNVLGSYPQQTIREIWFGKKAEQMREHMLHNDLNMGCNYCKLQLESNRFQGLPSMHAEEFATSKIKFYPRIIEFELSNTCNLQCVMCSGRVSSAIRANREEHEPLPLPYDDNFVEQLKEFIPHLKQAYFFGGEPFLIPIYFKIWEQIIKINPYIKLYAVTNGTVMNERIEKILKKTNFNITVSLDSLIKQRAETIRSGCNFDEVKKNIFKFQAFSQNNLSISHTPMTVNWDETPDIINFCNKINAIINLSYVEGPAKFALWSLMPDKLNEIYDFYNTVEWKENNKSFKAKYNIRVFNEWKQQVLFFKNRNQEILNSFSDINTEWEAETDKIEQFFTSLKTIRKLDQNKLEKFVSVFRRILENTTQTPWYLKSLKNITQSLSDVTIVSSPQFEQYLNNPELLNQFFDESQQAEFFNEYY